MIRDDNITLNDSEIQGWEVDDTALILVQGLEYYCYDVTVTLWDLEYKVWVLLWYWLMLLLDDRRSLCVYDARLKVIIYDTRCL